MKLEETTFCKAKKNIEVLGSDVRIGETYEYQIFKIEGFYNGYLINIQEIHEEMEITDETTFMYTPEFRKLFEPITKAEYKKLQRINRFDL